MAPLACQQRFKVNVSSRCPQMSCSQTLRWMSVRCRANQKKTQEGGALTALCLMFSRDKQVRAVRHLGKDIFQIPNTNGRVRGELDSGGWWRGAEIDELALSGSRRQRSGLN